MRRLRRVVAVFVGLLVLAFVVPVVSIEWGCRGGSEHVFRVEARLYWEKPDDYQRDQASTYYTFPEWYIVYAAEDFATFVATKNESAFHYVPAIAGFWQSFCTIRAQTRGWADP